MIEENGINIETSNVKITSLGLDGRITNKLRVYFGIKTLEELLELDYECLFRIRGLGEESILKLKECIHKFGYSFKNEKLTINEVKEEYRKQGKLLLEELGLASDVCIKLYRNNIYTLEELVQYGDDVYDLDKFGVACGNKLKAFLKVNNYDFSKREYLYGDIETLGLITKVKNILYKYGINNIYQLKEYRYEGIILFEKLGEKGFNEILGVMKSFGIKFFDRDNGDKLYTINDVINDKIIIDETSIEILKNQIQLLEYLKKEKEKLIEKYKMILEIHEELLNEEILLDNQKLFLGGDKNGLYRKRNK